MPLLKVYRAPLAQQLWQADDAPEAILVSFTEIR